MNENEQTDEETLKVIFDPVMTPEDIAITIKALGDYYRACGGAGLEWKFFTEEAEVESDNQMTASGRYKRSLYDVVDAIYAGDDGAFKKAEALLRAPIDNAVLGATLAVEQGWPDKWDSEHDRRGVRARWDDRVAHALHCCDMPSRQPLAGLLITLADMLNAPGFSYD